MLRQRIIFSTFDRLNKKIHEFAEKHHLKKKKERHLKIPSLQILKFLITKMSEICVAK